VPTNQQTFFDAHRMTLKQSLDVTAESLQAYGASHRHWAVAWSGGKDSTLLLVVLIYLIDSGAVKQPETLTICYADTRMELPPLALSAKRIISQLEARGITVRIVLPELDKRFYVYMLGRGVPPPNNQTLRWCTAQIKVKPMELEMARLVGHLGQKVLMLTGVRVGESASRDARIALSCGRNGAECGQGWFQETMPEALCDTLAPILHWRVCHVWEYLTDYAPTPKHGQWDTTLLAQAYGNPTGDNTEAHGARTGCVGCPLANVDTALDYVLDGFHARAWDHLTPLKELRPLYRELRLAKNRLRKPGGEARKDGSLSRNQNRMGPLTLDARLAALERVLDIQTRVNDAADSKKRDHIDLLNSEEEGRIRELIDQNTWPNKWTGEEPRADEPYEPSYVDGTRQRLIFGE